MQFSVSPATVPYSTDGAVSVVDLTLTVTNDGSAAVTCARAVLTIPYSGTPAALTADPSTVTTAPGDATPWATSSDGAGTVYAVPLPPATGLAAGEAAVFLLGSVVVNQAPGTATIEVVVDVDGTPVPGGVDVVKNRAAQPGEGVPSITSFTVSPARVAEGGSVTVSWVTEGATTCLLEPGPVPLPTPGQGRLPATVPATTVFRLVALSASGSATQSAVATVMPPQVVALTADPSGPVAAGVAVTLAWSVEYAATCSIDNGVGPVAASGTTVVTPAVSTTYTLVADGQALAAVTVTVT